MLKLTVPLVKRLRAVTKPLAESKTTLQAMVVAPPGAELRFGLGWWLHDDKVFANTLIGRICCGGQDTATTTYFFLYFEGSILNTRRPPPGLLSRFTLHGNEANPRAGYSRLCLVQRSVIL